MDRKSGITTVEMIDFYANIRGSSPALSQRDRTLSYQQLASQATELASAMQLAGIGIDDRVAVLSLNRIEQLVIIYATMKIGAIYVPINFRLAAPELKYILQDSRAKALFFEADLLPDMDGFLAELPDLDCSVLLDAKSSPNICGWDEFMGSGKATPKLCHAQADQAVYQMYTSGTTGFPKGVVITQQQLAIYVVLSSMIPPRMSMEVPQLCVAPLFHAAGLCSAITALSCGRWVSIMREFNPQSFVETLVNEKIADTLVVPAMLQAIVHTVDNLQDYDFSHLKKITYGASPISEDLLRKSIDIFDCDFQQAFGMTEMVAGVTILTAEDHHRALTDKPGLMRSCGRAAPFTKIKIIDPQTGAELPCNQVGEIIVQAPFMMQGYSQQPEKTAQAIQAGWYHTGDGGYMDDEGYVYIKDRIKDMIISGGENVYPAEVENALASHPQIADSAVIGLPDQKYGQAVVAICVATDQLAPPDAESLIDSCRQKIAGYKIPRHYYFVDELPRNASGKLLKKDLREQFETTTTTAK